MMPTDIVEVQGLSFKVRRGTWDEGIVHEVVDGNSYSALLNEIEPGTICLDVGAHIGSFTVLAASRGARVYAFEPRPGNYDLLVENVALNGLSDRVTALQKAAAGVMGTRRMPAPNENTGGGGLWGEGEGTIEVDCIDLLDFIKHENLTQCRGLKMDCEGSEWEILAGFSAGDLRRFDVISLEYHNSSPGDIPGDLVQRLQSAGFVTQRTPAPPSSWERLGLIHAVQDQFVAEKARRLLTGKPFEVKVHLAESRYTRLPIVGWLWGLIRRGAHELVVYYLNELARQQRAREQELEWVMEMTASRLEQLSASSRERPE